MYVSAQVVFLGISAVNTNAKSSVFYSLATAVSANVHHQRLH